MSKTKRKVSYGADSEADAIFDKLPRVGPGDLAYRGRSAFIAIDAAGRLIIALEGGGLLSINERDLAYVHGDEIFEA